MKLKSCILYCLCFFPVFLHAQRESVYMQIKSAAPLRPFTYYQPSDFELRNGQVNAALTSANGYQFQINGIAAKNLTCNKRLNQNQFKVVLIDNRMNKTYVSTHLSKGKVLVSCRSRGAYELVYEGEIFLNNQRVSVQANLVGKVRKLKDLKTN